MTIPNRTVSIKSVFASTANTTIPTPPSTGVSYRNTGTTAAEIGKGWPFKEVVDSAKFNQAMYEYTTICQQLEKYGFLPWSANTDYPAQGCALGSDGKIYQAKQATGPSSTSIDPTTDTSHTYWDLFYYATVTANRALVSNGNGKVSASATTATEIGYVHGVTSAIQTQLNNKANNNAVVHLTGNETITGAKTFSSTISGNINGNAATVTNGVYTTGNQTIGGTKTFSAVAYGTASDVAGSIVTTVHKSKAQNGYFQFGNGLIVQWGRVTASGRALTITLPKAFSSATSYSISAITNNGKAAFTQQQTSTTFHLDASGGIGNTSLNWIAIGY